MTSPADIVFVNFDANNAGTHDGLTRRQVRSEAAKASYKSGLRKPKASKKRIARQADVASSAAARPATITTPPVYTDDAPSVLSARAAAAASPAASVSDGSSIAASTSSSRRPSAIAIDTVPFRPLPGSTKFARIDKRTQSLERSSLSAPSALTTRPPPPAATRTQSDSVPATRTPYRSPNVMSGPVRSPLLTTDASLRPPALPHRAVTDYMTVRGQATPPLSSPWQSGDQATAWSTSAGAPEPVQIEASRFPPIFIPASILSERERAQAPYTPGLTPPTGSGILWPVPFQAFYPAFIDYMWPFMQRGWLALGATPDERSLAMNYVQRLVFSEPTYFYINMVSIAGDLVSRGCVPKNIYWWLKSQAVAAINEALGDPRRQLAPGTILSVGRIALHEIVVGDKELGQRIHRPAQARMLKMAGGLKALGLPHLVEEHVMWAERLMTHQTGVAMLSNTSTRKHDIRADVAVLDTYLPARARGQGRL